MSEGAQEFNEDYLLGVGAQGTQTLSSADFCSLEAVFALSDTLQSFGTQDNSFDIIVATLCSCNRVKRMLVVLLDHSLNGIQCFFISAQLLECDGNETVQLGELIFRETLINCVLCFIIHRLWDASLRHILDRFCRYVQSSFERRPTSVMLMTCRVMGMGKPSPEAFLGQRCAEFVSHK